MLVALGQAEFATSSQGNRGVAHVNALVSVSKAKVGVVRIKRYSRDREAYITSHSLFKKNDPKDR